jgi:hypothetical protein
MSSDLRAREEELLHEVAHAAEESGLHLEILRRECQSPQGRAGALIRVRHPEGALDLVAEVKTQLTVNNFGSAVVQARRHGRGAVLITDYVNSNLAERLRQQDVFFLDAAGNIFLRDRGLYVSVTGRRNDLQRQRLKERVRAFRPSGLKLIFALLSRPEMVEADFRTLAKATGISLGTVQWVMRDLAEAHFVHRIGRTRRVLLQPRELLDTWAQAFAHDLRPRLLVGRFAAPDIGWWRRTDPRDYDALWGGEPAGARLTGFLKPGTLTLYADKLPAKLLIHQRLKTAEHGQIDVLKKFWRFKDSGEERGVVPVVLAYADLMAIGDDRTREAANRLFERHIDGPFRSYLARATG